MKVFDIHANLLPRLDIGHRLGENIGPLFRKEGGDIAPAFCFLINLLRLLALTDDAANPPVADGHDELVDRGVMRQWKDIDGLYLTRVRILKLLRHLHRADVTADGCSHISVLERHGD